MNYSTLSVLFCLQGTSFSSFLNIKNCDKRLSYIQKMHQIARIITVNHSHQTIVPVTYVPRQLAVQ